MSLTISRIHSVRAFSLPGGCDSKGEVFIEPGWVLVRWQCDLQEILFQIYVNGIFAGATSETSQRGMIVPLPFGDTSVFKIEVLAVEPNSIVNDYSGSFLGRFYSGRVKIKILRSQKLPTDVTADIFYDKGTGQIDYSEPFNNEPIRLWPVWQKKSGFGYSKFGADDFGFDSSAAVGFGLGCFGLGQFGLDADAIEWLSPKLDAGVYKFALVLTDSKGRKSLSSQIQSIVVIPPVEATKGLVVNTYDSGTKQLVFEIL